MAGETGITGGSDYFPVFKASEGAFDRAKYDEQSKAMVKSDGVNVTLTGKEIDEDLKKKKVSAEDATKKANKFYDDSFDRNLKEIDPAIVRSGIYYDNASSSTRGDRIKIKKRIEKGEAIDGKEIFEMSKKSAESKILNINRLKTGKLTEVVEILGSETIKDFDLYEDVKSNFNSKIQNDKLKFDAILDKLFPLLSSFNENETVTSQNYMQLYTTENKAILAALAKILEGEGFDSDMIKESSKHYNKHMLNLIEKDKGSSIDNIKMDKEGIVSATGGTGATGTVSEQKLEEKKEPTSATGPTGPSPSTSALEGSNTTGTIKSPTGPSVSTSTTETLSTKTTVEEKKGAEVKTAEQKLEESKKPEDNKVSTGTVDNKTTTDEKNKSAEKGGELSEQSKGILDMLGIKKAETGATGEKGEGSKGNKNELTTGSPKVDQGLEQLGYSKSKEKESSEEKNKETSKNKKDETKLEEKVNENISKKTETSTISSPIKETTTQNLSSVLPNKEPDKKEEPKKEETKTVTTTTETKTEEKKSEKTAEENTSGSSTTENKEKKEEQDKMNKELSDNMKSMVSLLNQLNNTLKNPLIVIPNDKKFH